MLKSKDTMCVPFRRSPDTFSCSKSQCIAYLVCLSVFSKNNKHFVGNYLQLGFTYCAYMYEYRDSIVK